MPIPNLTPTSTTSRITLPSSVSTSATLETHIKDACSIGAYTGSVGFLTGAAAQVAYTYKKLGGDILDLEITSGSVFANYEEATLEYSYLVNIHQSKNALSFALGSATGSFDHQGQLTAGTDASLKFPNYTFDYALKMGDRFSHEAGVGGSIPIYSASFDRIIDKQDYDLQSIVSSSAAAGGVPYSVIDRTKKSPLETSITRLLIQLGDSMDIMAD